MWSLSERSWSMRSVPKSRVVPPGTRVWNRSATRPVEGSIATCGLILGKYKSIIFCVYGLRKREGMLVKRLLQVVGSVGSSQAIIVLLATSWAVSWLKTLEGTTGITEGSSCEKSPVHRDGCGSLLLEKLTGDRE